MNINPGDKITAGFLNSLKNVDIRKGTTVKGTDVGNAPVPKLMQVSRSFYVAKMSNCWKGYCNEVYVERVEEEENKNVDGMIATPIERAVVEDESVPVYSFIGPYRKGDFVYVHLSPYSGLYEVISGFTGPRLCRIEFMSGHGFMTIHKGVSYSAEYDRDGDPIEEMDPPDNEPQEGDVLRLKRDMTDMLVVNPRPSLLDPNVLYFAHHYHGSLWVLENQAVFQDWDFSLDGV
jgi:hypothetical protein